jgi:hypothetical protein
MALRAFRLLTLFAAVVSGSDAFAQPRGVVNAMTVTPLTSRPGETITAVVRGVNPCGAVLLDWGDGTWQTHPIYELPMTQTHTYAAAGQYRVSARGMGNCDGEVLGQVRIAAPPERPGGPQLTRLTVASPGTVDSPVSMVVHGRGACTVSIAYGDGNTQELQVELPHTFAHVYAVARAYNVSASAKPPCEGGRHTVRLEVSGQSKGPRISGLTAAASAGRTPGTATIQIDGSGTCSYSLDYGDGNSEQRTASLPDRVQHVYGRGATFVVVATAQAPCTGVAEDTLELARRGRGIERLIVSPSPAATQTRVTFRIEGRGSCLVTVDFGDGTDETIDTELPARVVHRYERPGRYEIVAWTEAPCSGKATFELLVRR